MKICSQCKTGYSDDTNYCTNCGGVLITCEETNVISRKTQSSFRKIISIIVVLAIIIGGLYYIGILKSDEQKIRERISDFEDAYNDGDAEAMLACFDRQTRNAYKSVMNIFGSGLSSLTGFNVEYNDLFSIGVAIDGEIHFVIQAITSNGDEAVVNALLGSEEGTFTLVKEGWNWYISN